MEKSYTLFIKEARKRAGLTQEEVAVRIGIEKKTYVKAENTGSMRMELFVRICELFRLSMLLYSKDFTCMIGEHSGEASKPMLEKGPVGPGNMEARYLDPVVQEGWKERLNKKL